MLKWLNGHVGRSVVMIGSSIILAQISVEMSVGRRFAYATVGMIPLLSLVVLVIRDQVREMGAEWKRIDACYRRDLARIHRAHEVATAKIEEDHQWEMRKIRDLAAEERTFSDLRTGDWITWIPCERPLKPEIGRIVGFYDDYKLVVNRIVDGELVMQTHNCSEGAEVRQLSLLEVVAWQSNSPESLELLAG